MSFFNIFDYTVYSFKDLSGAIAHPDLDSFVFTEGGVGQILIGMTNEKTFHEIDVRGNVLVGKIPGDNGQLQIQCQQTSNINKWLQNSYNKLHLKSAETSNWAQMTATLRNVSDGTSHEISGISFSKIPDKIYSVQGQMINWVLYFANIIQTSNTPSMSGKSLINQLSDAGQKAADQLTEKATSLIKI